MVSLTDLRARNVQPVWQEAVAVVQELVQTITASGVPLPDLDHVALIPNGDVVALPGSPEPTDPVRQAATMLQTLVNGTATPPELGEFIEKNLSGSGASPTLVDFGRNLSFFERPGRRADIERLVSRAATAEQNTRADEELRRLKEKAVDAPDRRMDETVFMDTMAMQRPRSRGALALVGLLLVGVVAGGAWWWRERATAPQPPAPAPPTQAAAATATGGAAAPGPQAPTGPAGAAVGAPAPSAGAKPTPVTSGGGALPPQAATSASGGGPSAPQAANPAAPPQGSLLERATAAVQSAVDSLVGSQPVVEHRAAPIPVEPPKPPAKRARHKKPAPAVVVPEPPPQVAETAPVPVAEPVATPVPSEVEPVATDDTIYTLSDAAVTPPVLVRPVLPKDPPPGVPLDQIGTMEVLVDEQGNVDSVRLVSPGNRYHDRMLVSAAKTWRFRPAFKDGHPVRFRASVRLTI